MAQLDGSDRVQVYGAAVSLAVGMRQMADAFADVSPLISELSGRIAGDPDVLALLTSLAAGQLPTQIYGAVNYLLAGSDERLARYFACRTPRPLPLRQAYPVFREFCLRRQDEIRTILASRTMQLTFPERAAPVLIALERVEAAAGEPVGLIEVGCSAGLLLHVDHYRYDFGRHGMLGDGPVIIRTELTGSSAKAPIRLPAISGRVGIDLHPIDLHDPDAVEWVLAALPPDRADRRASAEAALAFARDHPMLVLQGDAMELLSNAAARLEGPLCVLNSHCLYQWPATRRDAFEVSIADLSRERDVHRVSIEISGQAPAEIHHRLFHAGRLIVEESYGRADNFGAFVEID